MIYYTITAGGSGRYVLATSRDDAALMTAKYHRNRLLDRQELGRRKCQVCVYECEMRSMGVGDYGGVATDPITSTERRYDVIFDTDNYRVVAVKQDTRGPQPA